MAMHWETNDRIIKLFRKDREPADEDLDSSMVALVPALAVTVFASLKGFGTI